MATVSVDMEVKSVVYNGKNYATLDFTDPSTFRIGTQDNFLEMPEGWDLADNSEGVVEQVVAKFPWGTSCLVLSDGTAFCTKSCGLPGDFDGVGRLVREAEGRRYKVLSENRRVLICTKAPAAGDHCVQALARMWQTREFADCEVVCNGRVFQCHRIVLAQASPVFKQMLSGEMLEAKAQRIQLEGLETETEAASAFLEFVYTGVLDCKSKHFPTVVKLADFYQLDITTKTCSDMLQAVDSGNVVPMARLFKSKRENHRFKPYWVKLARKMQKTDELAFAVLSEV